MLQSNAMTIGQLSQRTSVPIKVLRHYEDLGFLYTQDRSESNYRLFGEEAVWCVQATRLFSRLPSRRKARLQMAAEGDAHRQTSNSPRDIGPIGTAARLLVGLLLVGLIVYGQLIPNRLPCGRIKGTSRGKE